MLQFILCGISLNVSTTTSVKGRRVSSWYLRINLSGVLRTLNMSSQNLIYTKYVSMIHSLIFFSVFYIILPLKQHVYNIFSVTVTASKYHMMTTTTR
jgi:hypothetical protein